MATGTGGEDLEQYFEQFPGLKEISSSIAKAAVSDGIKQQSGDDLQLAVFLTSYDPGIKAYCSSHSE